MGDYNFKLVQTKNSRGNFISVGEHQIIFSLVAGRGVFGKVNIFLDKRKKAILIKNDENGSCNVKVYKKNKHILRTIGMEKGRYSFLMEYAGGYIFVKKK